MIKKMWALWLMMLLSWATTKATTSSNVINPLCHAKCGNVSVPYPFGIDHSNCAMNNTFLLTCNRSSTPAVLIYGTNIIVLHISIEEGILVASVDAPIKCYNESGLESEFGQSIQLGDGPFRFSDSRNKLTVFGCDTLALTGETNGTYTTGCLSYCTAEPNFKNQDSCSGMGCCQTPIPKSLKTLYISLGEITNHTNSLQFNPCDYAILADERTFNISERPQLSSVTFDEILKSNVTIEWVVKEETCRTSKHSSDYACGQNTNCTDSENGQGYRCLCKDGFLGNPYLPHGCQDIDECEEPEIYKCEGNCKNTNGNYTCSCPLGMRGDGKVGCQGFRITTIVAVIGAIVFLVIIGVLAFIACKHRRRERNFFKNGGMILKNQRVRIFSKAELAKATKNYDNSRFLGEGGFGSVYKGVLQDNTQVAVKKPKEMDKTRMNQEFQHEIGIVSQVNHKNVVKLLGLCLETEVPLLVYEFISNGTLFHHIHDKKSQILRTWNDRLRIATETSLALHYFHSLANPPIIHGDVKSANILLDDNGTTKVSDFGTSVLISPGQTLMVTKVQGTFGYLDPEYLMTGILTEKSDVYSFGVVLVELLTGLKAGSHVASGKKFNIIQYFISSIESNSLSQVLGFEVADKGDMEEIELVADLAKRCLTSSGVTRPTMKEVVEELTRLTKLHHNLWAQENSEETEHLLGESSFSSNVVTPPETRTVITLEIEQNYSDSI